jgi:DNA-binding Lrp family transcriptional regulator
MPCPRRRYCPRPQGIRALPNTLESCSVCPYSTGMRVQKAQKVQDSERLKRNEEKWSPVLMEAGWTVLPSIILEKQHALGLDAVDVNILLQLARYWWFSDRPPYPSKATIAECMNVNPSTVRRHIARMERDGFIRREYRYNPKRGGQDTNAYHFTGLIKAAKPFAVEAIDTREQRKAEDLVRRRRKKPQLVVDNTRKRRGGK